jgi:hypothetical protein
MKTFKAVLGLFCTLCGLAISARVLPSQEKAARSTVQVHMVITDQRLTDTNEVPVLWQDAVQVKQSKNALNVDQVIPASGDNAALPSFILIDDTLDHGIGTNLADLRDFINAQPASTLVGVASLMQQTTTGTRMSAKEVSHP